GADIVGETVYVNLVKSQLGLGTVKDLGHKEVKDPERTFNQGKTFELKFTEVSSDDYEFPSIYVTRSGASVLPYVTKEDTEEIVIEALPLPLKEVAGVMTAHSFLDDDQKIQLVLYDGLQNTLN